MAQAPSRPAIAKVTAPKRPNVVEQDLGGGLHALCVRQAALPLVEFRLAVPLAVPQIKKPASLAVLSESVMAGTEHESRLSLAQAVGGLGGHLGGYVDEDRFVLTGSVLAQNLAPFLDLVADVVSAANYPAAEVRADRGRVADEISITLSLPDVIARQALRRRLFGGHPYATEIPSPAAVRQVSASELRLLHPVLFDEGPAHLVLVGDVQPARATAMAGKALGRWIEGRTAGSRDLPPVRAPRTGPVELVGRPSSVQSNIRLGGSLPSQSSGDWPAASLALGIFGGMFSSRLILNLRERNGYTYSPRSVARHARAGSTLAIVADVATAVVAPALVEIRYELGKLVTAGITDEELELARHHAIGRFSFETATQPGLATALLDLAVNGAGPGYLSSYPKSVIALKKDDVQEAAKRYFAPSGLVTVVIGDPEVVAGSLSSLDDVVVREL
ncbi:MAG TPA: pitrilysin family protein [Acidimicrobiales bacterium]|nr:pitrilysin family protein [Acidimicrobiales bacterium]